MTSVLWNLIELIAMPAALLVAYLLFFRRLADVVQPLRLEMAELGERLLASSISDRRKAQVSFYLENAFSGYVMALAVVLFPVFVALTLIQSVFKQKIEDIHASPEEKKLAVLFTVSVFAANPLFGLILFAELFLLGLTLFTISGQAAVVSAISRTLRAERAVRFSKMTPA
jgi:hypothetical protein